MMDQNELKTTVSWRAPLTDAEALSLEFSMQQNHTRSHLRVILVSLIVMIFANAAPSASLAEPHSKRYIGQFARLTAQIPSDWSVDPTGKYDYEGADGFVASRPIEGTKLQEACTDFAESALLEDATAIVPTSWSGQDACQFEATYFDRTSEVLIVPHGFPFAMRDVTYSFVALIADSDHLETIANSMSFAPERVDPEAYVLNVLEIVKARSYWSSNVDWELVERTAKKNMELGPSMAMAQVVIAELLTALRTAGDNHSYLLRPDNLDQFAVAEGYGFLLAADRVVTIYAEGPAAIAGLQIGDTIELMNGVPPVTFPYVFDPYNGWRETSINLSIHRAGDSSPMVISIEASNYSQYAAPTGERLAGDIGYIAVPGFWVLEKGQEYVEIADGILRSIDQTSTCGWIVDLRLDTGGNYPPMISAVGPILGNGRFVGWELSGGYRYWVSYADGAIRLDEMLVSDYLGENEYELKAPAPPVAVLTGPLTGSSGEVATLAFVGRPDTRLFGETTAGASTAIRQFVLFDGTVIGLATSAMIDRTGETHLEGVVPNETVATDWSTYGTDGDPVIAAAQEWLSQQPACAMATPTN
jgi:C-terminal processing protease CtpA/Prc